MNAGWRQIFPYAQRARAEFLLDGEQAYAAMKAAIKTADSPGHYIYILGWTLETRFPLTADSPETLFDILRDATNKVAPGKIPGVEVRGLIWAHPMYEGKITEAIEQLNQLKNTTFFTDSQTFFPEESNRYLQRLTRPLPPFYASLKSLGATRYLTGEHRATLQTYLRLLSQRWGAGRNLGAQHEKILIVKGREGLIGFCGGLDFHHNRVISEVNGRPTRLPAYHDAACKVDGRAAYHILAKFKMRWASHPAAGRMKLRGAEEPFPDPVTPYSPFGPYAPGPHEPPAPGPFAKPAPYVTVVGTYNAPRIGADGRRRLDRSARKAYFDIIDNARSYIYIEDQYLTNLEIAARLNKKIQDPAFQLLTIVIQQASETHDMLIPTRKRDDFLKTLYGTAAESSCRKVTVCVIDKGNWKRERYHPGLHSKVLIADDTIAIIGSTNINRRSLTLDSETALVIFDQQATPQSFARRFRQAIWREYSKHKDQPSTYDSPWSLPQAVRAGKGHHIVTRYRTGDVTDVDEAIKAAIVQIDKELRQGGLSASNIPVDPFALQVAGAKMVAGASMFNLHTPAAKRLVADVDPIFAELWEHVIDPWVRD